MTVASSAPSRRFGPGAMLSWAVSIGCNVVLPFVTYNQLTGAGWSDFSALVASGVWPVVDMVIYLIWHRRVDEFAVMTMIFLVLTLAVTGVGPHSARLLLVKDSLITGLFGVVCLISLATPRPLMFYLGRKFGTDGSANGVAHWNGLWQYEGFRRTMTRITMTWGLGYVLEAIARVGLSYALPTGTMVAVNSVLAYGVPALLIAWTITYSKRARAKGRGAQAAAAGQAAAAAVN
ncbi:VC0807 family protein [Streptomyces sp. NPDC001678]|uniref:VC0807 family protein n=1 Tax=Streptomyces sp. NPDC001678 TaxID=3364599 RepID=UPI00367DDAD4